MHNHFTILYNDSSSRARVGALTTAHGVIETPAYAIVATHAQVKAVILEDVKSAGTQALMANTYHLWKALGDEGLATYPGLHAAMGWQRPIMTDSGGFQVFSMGAAREHGVGKFKKEPERSGRMSHIEVTDDGVYFNDDGRKFLDAAISMRIQSALGADIIFAFDECTSPYHDKEYTRLAMERTHRWALKSLEAHNPQQLLYGIVQGGAFEDLRRESARCIARLPFDGIAIGGAFSDSFGSTRRDTANELGWVINELPEDRPRHLLGIGRIPDLFAAVEQGIDTFDCVTPTREARHGWLWTPEGRMNVLRSVLSDDQSVIDKRCGCSTCAQGVTRAMIRTLFKAKDHEAGRFATIHNIWFFNNLMHEMREAIVSGRWKELRERYGR